MRGLRPTAGVFGEVMVVFPSPVTAICPVNILILRRSLLIHKLDNFSSTFSCSQKVKPVTKTILKSASFFVFD